MPTPFVSKGQEKPAQEALLGALRDGKGDEEVTTTMARTETLDEIVAPIVAAHDLELFDLELAGGVLKVTVDRSGGVGLDEIAAVTRAISRNLDERDPIAGRYTLEVSSPGLERTLRVPEHYRWAVGKKVSIKTLPSFEGERRITGELTEADDRNVVVQAGDGLYQLSYEDIASARTVFEWGPAPKPGGPKAKPAGSGPKESSTDRASTEKRAEAS